MTTSLILSSSLTTFMPSAALLAGALLLFSARITPGPPQPATLTNNMARTPQKLAQNLWQTDHAIHRTWLPPSGDTERAVDRKWNLAALSGIWFQPPRKVLTGRRARIRWWHRLRSLVALVVLVAVGGAFIATAFGALFFAGTFLLEQAIG
ncbi:MAG: hypothetical protein OSA06_03245 [Acidimicrobiales bacterium]|nr:hypothetical protein [Acidimicrobiales bacterium]